MKNNYEDLFPQIKDKLEEIIKEGTISIREDEDNSTFVILWKGIDKETNQELYVKMKFDLRDITLSIAPPVDTVVELFYTSYTNVMQRWNLLKGEKNG